MALVNVKDLTTVLNRVTPGLGIKENDIQANCFLFLNGRVFTYNDEVSVSSQLPKGMKDIECVVQAKEFLQLLSKMKEEEVDISISKGDLKISSRRTKASFLTESEIKMPVADVVVPTDFRELPSDFLYAVKCCLPIVGRDMSKPLSTCLYMKWNRMEVADSSKAGRYVFKSEPFKESIYLPGTSAKAVTHFDVSSFSVDDGWIHFRCKDGETVVSARTYYGDTEPADLDFLLNQSGDHVDLPKDLAGALERTGVFSNAKTGTEGIIEDVYVELTIHNDWCVIRCQSPIGTYEEKVRVLYEGPELIFSTSPELLLDALEANRTCEVCQKFVKIYDDKFTHLVAVSRPTEKPEPKKPTEVSSDVDDMDVIPF